MKKGVKLIISLLIMICPLLIKANTYNLEKENVNGYILRNACRDTYNRYLLDGNRLTIPYVYSKTTSSVSSEYKFGGMLSRDEYTLSKRNNRSYLYNGSAYWTLTARCSSKSK